MPKEKKGRGKEVYGPGYSPLRRPSRASPINKNNISQARGNLFSLYRLDLDKLDLMFYGKNQLERTQAFKDKVFLEFAGRCPKLAEFYQNYFDCSVQFGMWKREEGLRVKKKEAEEKDAEVNDEEKGEEEQEGEEDENTQSIEDDEDPDDEKYSTESSSDSSSDDSVEPEVEEIKETTKKQRKNVK